MKKPGFGRSVLFVWIFFILFSAQAFPGAAWGDGHFVAPGQVDLTVLLAPPPSDDSSRTRSEIAELAAIQKKRTPEEKARAVADNTVSVFRLASGVLGPKFTAENLPLTAGFFERLADDAHPIVGAVKKYWGRPRPFRLSSRVQSCFGPISSGAYPSGHTTFAYMSAVVLADAVPEKKAAIFARAAQYGRSRMVCGVHYPSDVEGGRIAGTVIAAFAMQNPEFAKEFKEVKKEIRKTLGLE
jgi:acid phosphatase (class A)